MAYRTSGFKDWWAISNSGGTNLYVNNVYTATQVSNGWQFVSSDGNITKTITLGSGSDRLEAAYALAGGVTTLYVRHGLSPDALSLMYQGQANLALAASTGHVQAENISPSSVAVAALDYADVPSHSNVTYNAAATDRGAGFATVNMRDQAQTQQVELQSTNTAFSFALEIKALQGDAAPNGDNIQNYQAAQLGADPFNPWDTNGLTTAWELKYFGATNINANADPDGDGQSNLQEFLTGTDPTKSSSFFHIISITRQPNGNNVIVWTSVPGKNYQVYATTSLAGAYTPVGSTVPSAGATTSYTDVDTTDATKYYKVKVVP